MNVSIKCIQCSYSNPTIKLTTESFLVVTSVSCPFPVMTALSLRFFSDYNNNNDNDNRFIKHKCSNELL